MTTATDIATADTHGAMRNEKWFYFEFHKNGKYHHCDEFLAADASQAQSNKRLNMAVWIEEGGTVEFGLLTERYKRNP